MGERVIKAGGCVITCALLNRLAAEQQQQQQQPVGAEHDARTKARVEVIRAAVGLLSSMAFVTGTRQSLLVFVLALLVLVFYVGGLIRPLGPRHFAW
jgi:hypothetical protein